MKQRIELLLVTPALASELLQKWAYPRQRRHRNRSKCSSRRSSRSRRGPASTCVA
jgi:hypothetical protein